MSENQAGQVNEISTECSEIKFAKKLIGYDIGQVDRYIKNIAVAYQAAYDEYGEKCAEFNKLLDYYKKLDAHIQNRSSMDAITGVLQNTEAMMRQITDDAKAEAEKILEEICTKRFEAKMQAQRIIDSAREEVAAAKEQAQEIIKDAYQDANKIENQAKRNLQKANEMITRAMFDMKGLLTECDADVEIDGNNCEPAGDCESADEGNHDGDCNDVDNHDDEKPVQLKIVPFDSSKFEGRNKQA